jgi:response regulator RpfG family c-di-GMP phosphodiesterase
MRKNCRIGYLTAKSRVSMHRPINILVVEDDPNVSTVLTARLESLGYQICGTAETGLEAISGVYRHHPDLVTMDILLKGEMNGDRGSRPKSPKGRMFPSST